MNQRFAKSLTVGIFTLVLAVGAQTIDTPAKFRVGKVETDQQIEANSKTYIVDSKKKRFKPQTDLKATSENQLWLRRKLNSANYAYYLGTPSNNAAEALYRFPLGEMSQNEALGLKFYKAEDAKAFQDLQDIYFDAEAIYTSMMPKIWYFSTKGWVELSSTGKTSSLEISSKGKAFSIFHRGQKWGDTPLRTPLTDGQDKLLQFSADGFWSQAFFWQAGEGQSQSIESHLEMLPSPLIPTESKIDVLNSSSNFLDSVYYHQGLKIQIKQNLAYQKEVEKSLKAKYYKPLVLKDEQVIKAEYESLYDSLFNLGLSEVLTEFIKQENLMSADFNKIDEKLKLSYAKIDSLSIKPSGIKHKVLDADNNVLGLKIKLDSEDKSMPLIDAVWTGRVVLEKADMANLLKVLESDSLSKNLNLKLFYYKEPVAFESRDSIVPKYFYTYKLLELSANFNQKALTLMGDFKLPSPVEALDEVQAWLYRDSIKAAYQQKIEDSLKVVFENNRVADSIRTYQKLLNSVRGDFVEIPASSFMFKGGLTKLSPYAINTTEITQEHFDFVTGKNPSTIKGANIPVHHINWEDSRRFCREIGGDLPTEAQWQNAAMGNLKTDFMWGNYSEDARSFAAYDDNSRAPKEVKFYPANQYGLYDMNGNVNEWVIDQYAFWYLDWFYSNQDPEATSMFAHYRIYKGGSWREDKAAMLAYKTENEDPRYHADDLGMRCAFKGNTLPDEKELNNRLKLFAKRRAKSEPTNEKQIEVKANPAVEVKPVNTEVNPEVNAEAIPQAVVKPVNTDANPEVSAEATPQAEVKPVNTDANPEVNAEASSTTENEPEVKSLPKVEELKAPEEAK